MGALKRVSSIIRAVYYDHLHWKELPGGFIASAHLPNSNYKENEIVHSVNLLGHFLTNPELDNKFKVTRTKAEHGQIIHITAQGSVSEHMRENTVTGLKGIMIKEHARLADALITTRSLSQSYLHIEFPELSKLQKAADPEVMHTIQTLVHQACWFTLSCNPTVHTRDMNRSAGLLQEQINNLGLFNPIRAQYAHDIISVTRTSAQNVTKKVCQITDITNSNKDQSVIPENNNKMKFT